MVFVNSAECYIKVKYNIYPPNSRNEVVHGHFMLCYWENTKENNINNNNNNQPCIVTAFPS